MGYVNDGHGDVEDDDKDRIVEVAGKSVLENAVIVTLASNDKVHDDSAYVPYHVHCKTEFDVP